MDKRRIITDPYGLIVCLALDPEGPRICPKYNPEYEPNERITGDCETCPYCRTIEEVLEKMEKMAHVAGALKEQEG